MTYKEELYIKWKHIASVAIYKGKKYEGVPIDEKWLAFDGFFKDNVQRYTRAKKKWKDYKKITELTYNRSREANNISFIRKNKQLGYTKKNTVFTNPSDGMKYHAMCYKVVFNKGQVLGSRDVKNILAKKGIKRSMIGISTLLRKGKDLFEVNRLAKWKWRGRFQSLKNICESENISMPLLKKKIYVEKMSLHRAVEYLKNYEPTTYYFEGKHLPAKEICKILSDRYCIKYSNMRSRFYKLGYDVERLIIAPKAMQSKRVIAEKDGKKLEFLSICEAADKLEISRGNISCYANGKRIGKLKGYTFYLANAYP